MFSSKSKRRLKPVSLDKLIAVEWDIIKDLRKMLDDEELSVQEKIHVSNSIAYHAACLNKLLIQKGSAPFEDETLADLIQNIEPRFARRISVAYIRWKKRLS